MSTQEDDLIGQLRKQLAINIMNITGEEYDVLLHDVYHGVWVKSPRRKDVDRARNLCRQRQNEKLQNERDKLNAELKELKEGLDKNYSQLQQAIIDKAQHNDRIQESQDRVLKLFSNNPTVRTEL